MTFTSTCLTPPKGAARPRFARAGAHVRTYKADAHALAESRLVLQFRTDWAGREPPLEGPSSVTISAVLPRPKRLKCETREPAPVKPDVDNVAKLVLDALVKAGVLADDRHVVDLYVSKVYAAPGEQAHVQVWVTQERPVRTIPTGR